MLVSGSLYTPRTLHSCFILIWLLAEMFMERCCQCVREKVAYSHKKLSTEVAAATSLHWFYHQYETYLFLCELCFLSGLPFLWLWIQSHMRVETEEQELDRGRLAARSRLWSNIFSSRGLIKDISDQRYFWSKIFLIKDILIKGISDQRYFWSKIFSSRVLIKDISDQRYFLPGFCVKLHQQLVQQGSYRATTAGCGPIINKPFLFYSFHVKAWFVALWSVLRGVKI